MRHIMRLFNLLLLTGLLILQSACSIDDVKEFVGFGSDKTRNFVVLVDLSSASHDPERHGYYGGVISKEVLGGLGMFDRIAVLPIDKSSLTNAEEIFLADLSKMDFVPEMGPPLELEQQTKANVDAYKEKLVVEFEKSFQNAVKARSPQSGETDLFGALESVRRYGKSNGPTYVILLSDMMHNTKALSLETNNREFSSEKIDDFVQKAPSVDLTGYQVLVLTGDQAPNQATHFEAVRAFWKKYFELKGARLLDYSSAARSQVDQMVETAPVK
jgi:hypothetical protein